MLKKHWQMLCSIDCGIILRLFQLKGCQYRWKEKWSFMEIQAEKLLMENVHFYIEIFTPQA